MDCALRRREIKMNNIISQMLAGYETKNVNDEINALKEIIQEVVLCGLSRSDFFDKVAFYGGTALRIFYNIDRFSEDLDFALISPDKNFDLSKYFSYIENELNSYGINMEISTKQKKSDSNITSAFLKGDTLEHILPKYVNFIADDIVLGHNVKFDIRFISKNLEKLFNNRFKNESMDTMKLSRRYCTDITSHKLSNLANYFNIDSKGHHRGLKDCEMTYYVYEGIKNKYINK